VSARACLAFVLALFGAVAPALAQERVHVERFSGPHARAVRRQVVAALRRTQGIRVSTSGDGDARVEGRVFRVGRRWRARIRAIGPDGDLVDHVVTARRVGTLTGMVRAWARHDLAPRLAPPRVTREVEVEPPPPLLNDEAPAPTPAPAPTEPSARPLPAPLAVWVGASLTNRSFRYHDDLFAALRPYELPIAPVVMLGAEWFPGAHADLGVLSGLSLRAEGELAIAVSSLAEDGTAYPTDMGSVALGLRYRVRIDDLDIFADGGYRGVFFAIRDAGDRQRPDLPNIEIHAVRAGAGFRWDIGAGLFFTGQGAYLAPFSVGEIGSAQWFPRASVGGVEGDLGLGLRVGDVELRALFAWRRFFYAMNPEPGDRRVAGGAVDQYLSGVLTLTWIPSQLRP
jgi:hypothetical protein